MVNNPKRMITFSEVNLSSMKDFYDEIMDLKTEDISTVEAIVHYCEQKNIDIEDIISIIPDSLKAQIESEEIESGNVIKSKEHYLGIDLL